MNTSSSCSSSSSSITSGSGGSTSTSSNTTRSSNKNNNKRRRGKNKNSTAASSTGKKQNQQHREKSYQDNEQHDEHHQYPMKHQNNKNKKNDDEEQQQHIAASSSDLRHGHEDHHHHDQQRSAARTTSTSRSPSSSRGGTTTSATREYSDHAEQSYLQQKNKELLPQGETQSDRQAITISNSAASSSSTIDQQREFSRIQEEIEGVDTIAKNNDPNATSSNSTNASFNNAGSRGNGISNEVKLVAVTTAVAGSPSNKNMNSSLIRNSGNSSYDNSSLDNNKNRTGDDKLFHQSPSLLPPLSLPEKQDQDCPRDENTGTSTSNSVLLAPPPTNKRHKQEAPQRGKEELKKKRQRAQGPNEQVIAREQGRADGTEISVGKAFVGNPTPMTTRPSTIVAEQGGGYYFYNNSNYVNHNALYNNVPRMFPPNVPDQQEKNIRQNIYSGGEVDIARMTSTSRNHHITGDLQKTMFLHQSAPSIAVNVAHQPHHYNAHQISTGYQFQPFARASADSSNSNLGTAQLGLLGNGVNQTVQQHVSSGLMAADDILSTTNLRPAQASNLNMNYQSQQHRTNSQEYYLGTPANESLKALLDAQLRNLHAEKLLLLSLQQQHRVPQHEQNYPMQQTFAAGGYTGSMLGFQKLSNTNVNWIQKEQQVLQAQRYGQNQGVDQLFMVPQQAHYQMQQNQNPNSTGPANQHVQGKSSTGFEGITISSQGGMQNNQYANSSAKITAMRPMGDQAQSLQADEDKLNKFVSTAYDSNVGSRSEGYFVPTTIGAQNFGAYNVHAPQAIMMGGDLTGGNSNYLRTEQLLLSQQGIVLNSKPGDLPLFGNQYNGTNYPRLSDSHYFRESSPHLSNFNPNEYKILGNIPTTAINTNADNQDVHQCKEITEKTVTKAKKKGKDLDAPLNPLHAYNFFFRDERKKILKSLPVSGEEECDSASDNDMINDTCANDDEGNDDEEEKCYEIPSDEDIEKELKKIAEERRKIKMRVHKKTHGKIGFNDLTKVISERWQNANDKVKSYYKKFAVADAKRYAAEMKEYRRGFTDDS